ncbi:MAG: membrane protein insertase YidC, partial [Ottowia sp.]|nr:membrane protein insertase YidC [Ottowia sp.]
MNDIRRTILWVIFGFSMVLLWDKWQVHNGHKALFFPAPAVTAPAPAADGAAATLPASTAASVPSAAAVQAGAAAV